MIQWHRYALNTSAAKSRTCAAAHHVSCAAHRCLSIGSSFQSRTATHCSWPPCGLAFCVRSLISEGVFWLVLDLWNPSSTYAVKGSLRYPECWAVYVIRRRQDVHVILAQYLKAGRTQCEKKVKKLKMCHESWRFMKFAQVWRGSFLVALWLCIVAAIVSGTRIHFNNRILTAAVAQRVITVLTRPGLGPYLDNPHITVLTFLEKYMVQSGRQFMRQMTRCEFRLLRLLRYFSWLPDKVMAPIAWDSCYCGVLDG